MTYNYRQGAVVTFTRDDGQPGPGMSETFKASDGWKVEIQNESCVEITNYLAQPPVPSRVVPWHRIYEIRTI
jgi:hypothetical protein